MLTRLLDGARWLVDRTPPATRRAAVAVAGLAVIGVTVAGPATALGARPGLPRPPAAKELRTEYQAQPNFYYCGPAATRIALTVDGAAPGQDELAAALGTTVAGTDSALDVTRVLNDVGDTNDYRTTAIPGQRATAKQRERMREDITRAIADGRPVVVNVIGTAADTAGGTHAYPGGHYLTVVGYRDEGRLVRIADPANVNGVSSYWMATTDLANWAATRGYSA